METRISDIQNQETFEIRESRFELSNGQDKMVAIL